MRKIRLIYENLSQKQSGNKIAIRDKDQIKHLKVLRAKALPYEFEVVDDGEWRADAELIRVTKEGVLMELGKLERIPEPERLVDLYLPAIRQSKMETAVEQVTQLDLFSDIYIYFPDFSRYTKKKISENKLDRLEKKISAAYKQSLSQRRPRLSILKKSLKDMIEPLASSEDKENEGSDSSLDARELFAKETGKKNFIEDKPKDNEEANFESSRFSDDWLLVFPTTDGEKLDTTNLSNKLDGFKKVALFIGPEGGFSDEEHQTISKINDQNIYTFILPTGILTTETASLSIGTLLSALIS
jgi:RsmE family RNA methyltransferase